MVKRLNLQRDELAEALGPNHKAIRQFEKLFNAASDSANTTADMFPQLASLLASIQEKEQSAFQQLQILLIEVEDLRKQISDIQSLFYPVDSESLPYLETRKQIVQNKEGRINWTSSGQFNAGQVGINVPIGALNMVRAVNSSGLNLPAGRCVRLSGASLGLPTFNTVGNETAFDCIGVTAQNINNGDAGFICCTGVIENMDATGTPFGEVWSPGDVLYLGTSPKLTNVLPVKPSQLIRIGIVLSASSIFVYPNRNIKTDSISDFLVTAYSDGQLPIFDNVVGVWKNKTLTQGAGGIQITNAAGAITLALSNITNNQASKLVASSVTLSNGSGAAVGTLTNAPIAGNPTKWIPIDDNGTTRHIPSW